MVDDTQLRAMIKAAPNSLADLISLLYEGLGWPLYDTTFEPDETIE